MLALLADKAPAPVSAPFRTIQLTGSATLTAYVWNNVAMTFTDQLPAGNYDIIGARYEGASAICGRIAIPGAASRPGVPAVLDAVTRDHTLFRGGKLGVWGTFNASQTITLECLSTAADTAETLYLDVVGPK